MSHRAIQISFFVLATIILFVLLFFIFKPYLGVVFLSGILAVSFYPVYQRLLLKFNGRKNFAALVTTILVVVLIIIPAIFLSASLINEAAGLYDRLAFDRSGGEIAATINGAIQNLNSRIPSVSFVSEVRFETYAKDMLNWIIGHFDSIFATILGGLFKFVLMLLSIYYFLINGEKIKKDLLAWSPLPDAYDEEFFRTLTLSTDAVLRGRILVSLVQGLLLGIGFAVFGVSSPVLWGFVAAISSLIPVLGTSIVTIPAVVYLFLNGNIASGVGLLIWGAVLVGFVDNVLSWMFLKNRIRVHPLIVLFSIIGGVEFLGAIGLIIGPLTVSAFLALMKIYPSIMPHKNQQL